MIKYESKTAAESMNGENLRKDTASHKTFSITHVRCMSNMNPVISDQSLGCLAYQHFLKGINVRVYEIYLCHRTEMSPLKV